MILENLNITEVIRLCENPMNRYRVRDDVKVVPRLFLRTIHSS